MMKLMRGIDMKDKDQVNIKLNIFERTRPDTRLPKSRAGGQGPYLRSPDHLGRSSEVEKIKSLKKVKCDRPTDGQSGL